MTKPLEVLISGAGIAGLACALWLGRAGARATVVERAPSIRADGFIVSLSHHSYRFAEQLGLMPALRGRDALIRRSSYHDPTGRTLLELDYERLFEGVDVIQIMRDDLQSVLYDAARDLADFRFGASVERIEPHGDGAEVELDDGTRGRYDVVVGADGLHSAVRGLAFPAGRVREHRLGLSSAAYRLPNRIGLSRKFENHLERDRYMAVYTTREDELACVFVWASDDAPPPPMERRGAALREAFAGAPAIVQRVLEDAPGDGVYMDTLEQIEIPRWHEGRAVLLGDAAHGMTLLSGQGATAAFSGACHLAGALLEHPPESAFAAYDASLRPVISRLQPATRAAARWYVPRSRLKHAVRDAALRAFPNALFQRYFRWKYTKA